MARIGPLYAERSYHAATIFDALCVVAGKAGAVAVSIDVPEPSMSGRAIAETRGLSHFSEAYRMYRPGIASVKSVNFGHLNALTCLGMG